MASSGQDVIREFLISLGFKINPADQKKFEGTVSKVEKTVKGLGVATVGVATASQVMVTRFTDSMEKLYYSAKRANSSVLGLQAAGSGADRIGVGAERMQGAIENIARNIRTNPGIESVISSFGIPVKGRDMADVALDVAKALSKLPFYQAAQYGELFGIDSDTLYMLQQGLDKYQEAFEARKKLSTDLGIDTEEAARAAVEYKNTWRDIKDIASVLGDAITIKMLGPAKELAEVTKETLKDWVGIVRRTDSFGQFVDKLWQGFIRGKTEPGVTLTPEAQARAQKLFGSVRISDRKVGGRILNEGDGTGLEEFKQPPATKPAASKGAPSGASSGNKPPEETRGFRNNNPGNIEYGDFAIRMGAVGSDGRFAIFPSAEHGLRAASELLKLYGRTKRDTVRKVVNNWSNPKEDPTGNRTYISAVSGQLGGVDPDKKLRVQDPSTLANLLYGIVNKELGGMPYSGQQIAKAAGAQSPTVIHQKTEINIHGVTDPNQAGKVVLDNQDRVNGVLTRHTRGAAR